MNRRGRKLFTEDKTAQSNFSRLVDYLGESVGLLWHLELDTLEIEVFVWKADRADGKSGGGNEEARSHIEREGWSHDSPRRKRILFTARSLSGNYLSKRRVRSRVRNRAARVHEFAVVFFPLTLAPLSRQSGRMNSKKIYEP